MYVMFLRCLQRVDYPYIAGSIPALNMVWKMNKVIEMVYVAIEAWQCLAKERIPIAEH